MPPEFVQIGPIVISKVVLDVLAPLFGTVIGGFITYFTTRATENRKWKQQKEDQLPEQRREAIALSLEWITPIDLVLYRASTAVSGLLH